MKRSVKKSPVSERRTAYKTEVSIVMVVFSNAMKHRYAVEGRREKGEGKELTDNRWETQRIREAVLWLLWQ